MVLLPKERVYETTRCFPSINDSSIAISVVTERPDNRKLEDKKRSDTTNGTSSGCWSRLSPTGPSYLHSHIGTDGGFLHRGGGLGSSRAEGIPAFVGTFPCHMAHTSAV